LNKHQAVKCAVFVGKSCGGWELEKAPARTHSLRGHILKKMVASDQGGARKHRVEQRRLRGCARGVREGRCVKRGKQT